MQLFRKQSGVSTIELAITMPVFLLVLFAIVEYSVLLGALFVMNNATSEAARQATVFRSNLSSSGYATIARNALNDSLPVYVGSFRTNVVTSVTPFACGDSTCLRLRVDYPEYQNKPILGKIFSGLPLPANLRAESVARVETNGT